MSRYLLMPVAQEDLGSIRGYYLEEGGQKVARKMVSEFVAAFRWLAKNPGAGHVRRDLAEDRPILFWPLRDFLILYKPETEPLEILSIVRGSRDIPALLGRRGL